jgi:KUP system potassium uptake protein
LRRALSSKSFFLSRRALKPAVRSELPGAGTPVSRARWLASDATSYFRIPTERVVEVGTQMTV